MRAADLFSGWGGLSHGAEQAGVDVVWAGNHWPTAVRVHSGMHPDTIHACQDLQQIDWSTLPDYDLLLAAPACQGHSTASQPKRRGYHDALRATAMAVIDCADVTNPQAIIVENVPSFRQWRLYPWWKQGLHRLGYQLEERVLMASHFGVPQRRKRLFLVATRPGVNVAQLVPSKIEPAFGPCLEDDIPDSAWHDVATSTPRIKERVRRSRCRHGDRFLTQHTSDHHGVPLHEPIRTITTAPAHWNLVDGDRYRALTGRELARGMGFPDTFTWPTDIPLADVTKGIGNAVCPPLARQLVGVVADAISTPLRRAA